MPAATADTTNALNQNTAVGAVIPAYDPNGNLTFDGTYILGYDIENRLISATGAGTAATYAYGAQRRRKSRAVNGTTTLSVTDADNGEMLEYDGAAGQTLHWYGMSSAPTAGSPRRMLRPAPALPLSQTCWAR